MEALLLAATLSCADGAWLLEGLDQIDFLPEATLSEIRLEFLKDMPDNCTPEQYNPTGRK